MHTFRNALADVRESESMSEIEKELLSRMKAIGINIDEIMSYEQLQYFMKGYEDCMKNMHVVINDTFRNKRENEHDGE